VLLEIGLDHLQAPLQPALEASVADLVLDAMKVQVAVSHD
jgi:hypothetical protein